MCEIGKIPNDNNSLHIWFEGELIKGELIFNILIENASYPYEISGFKYFIIFTASLVDVSWNYIFVKDLLKFHNK
jgi:hypothetical protein